MASVTWEAGAYSTVLSTELNSMANNAKVISGEIDNSTELYLFDDVEWSNTGTFGGSVSAGAVIEVYLIQRQLDGTGYEDGSSSVDPPPGNLVGVFNLRDNSAQVHIVRQIPIPPDRYKYLLVNRSGQAASASGNALRRRPYRYKTV